MFLDQNVVLLSWTNGRVLYVQVILIRGFQSILEDSNDKDVVAVGSVVPSARWNATDRVSPEMSLAAYSESSWSHFLNLTQQPPFLLKGIYVY